MTDFALTNIPFDPEKSLDEQAMMAVGVVKMMLVRARKQSIEAELKVHSDSLNLFFSCDLSLKELAAVLFPVRFNYEKEEWEVKGLTSRFNNVVLSLRSSIDRKFSEAATETAAAGSGSGAGTAQCPEPKLVLPVVAPEAIAVTHLICCPLDSRALLAEHVKAVDPRLTEVKLLFGSLSLKYNIYAINSTVNADLFNARFREVGATSCYAFDDQCPDYPKFDYEQAWGSLFVKRAAKQLKLPAAIGKKNYDHFKQYWFAVHRQRRTHTLTLRLYMTADNFVDLLHRVMAALQYGAVSRYAATQHGIKLVIQFEAFTWNPSVFWTTYFSAVIGKDGVEMHNGLANDEARVHLNGLVRDSLSLPGVLAEYRQKRRSVAGSGASAGAGIGTVVGVSIEHVRITVSAQAAAAAGLLTQSSGKLSVSPASVDEAPEKKQCSGASARRP